MKKRKLIKLGGSVFEQLDPRYYEEWSEWLAEKNELIVMHGGGPALSAYCRELQIDSIFQAGVRVTTAEVLLGAERVLGGEVQSKIVYTLNQYKLPAVGITGIDGASIRGEKQPEYGAVGQVTKIEDKLFHTLMQTGFIPVVTSLITGSEGTLNCNGDTCAVALATELAVDEFELLTDVAGIKLNGLDQSEVTISDLQAGLESTEINGGMIPKAEALIEAARQGIKHVRIRFGQDVMSPGTQVKEEKNERITTNVSAS
ncbi:acetylglutamate kinase [Exiguobacterium antarcticum]|uniref:acetylglutamate kinase n=1 Tax=Exiguobacterium antarcticum TaxID=132920 RepID=A0ABT6R4Y1_9BACL|nr:acetylglutamate kinase [Exiguobacterium antarcticum]MDI3236019.1 acetylglutamate kinase [Exiguobacterium antarcticum]